MKKTIFLSLLGLLCCSQLFAQATLAEFKNSLKTNGTNIKDVMPIVHKKTGALGMIIADAKNAYAYKLDKNFKCIDQLKSNTKQRKYKVLIGSQIEGNNYRIFLSNKDRDEFSSILFSFDTQKTSANEFELAKKELLFQTFNHNEKLYFLTGNKTTGALYLTEFNDQGIPSKKEINLQGTSILNYKGRPTSIAKTLYTISHKGSIFISKFEKDTPNAIETASEPVKMYVQGDKLIITFDTYKKETQMITLDLLSKKLSKTSFDLPLQNIKTNRKKTNSFLYDNLLAQIAADKEVFTLQLRDVKTKNIIKTYSFTKKDKIPFKNGPIIQKGGTYASHREFEKTKKFLRKITAEKIGVSIIKIRGNYQFTIGGAQKIQRGGGFGVPMAGFGMPIGQFGATTVIFNPTIMAYHRYTQTKSTRIECVFDQNFEHLAQDKPMENVFEKIKKQPTYTSKAKTIFKYQDFYIKGDYRSSRKTYMLKKFTY